MKIEFDSNLMYDIKDAVMVQFLKHDLECVKQSLSENCHPEDIKYDTKLLKAYRTILKYYGETDV